MLKRTEPYTLGDIATLAGPGGVILTVSRPNGKPLYVGSGNGKVEFLLDIPGRWEYVWPDGSDGSFDVVERRR